LRWAGEIRGNGDDNMATMKMGEYQMPKLPDGAKKKGGRVYNSRGELIEVFEGKWRVVKDVGRVGWFRYNEHYDRGGYCDNPARGY
jgi:hypothetical protein